MWEICGNIVNKGERKNIKIFPNAGDYEIPATIMCGEEEGPTLVITAGIHSGEYPGIAAAIKTARAIDPKQLRGRLLIMHCVNTSGFWAKTNAVVAEDGFNLNHDYPGKAEGTVGERIADYFIKEVFPNTDFLLDLHSGGIGEPLAPCLFYPVAAGSRIREKALKAAMALDIPYIVASTADSGEYSYAAKMGVPGLLLERGYCAYCLEEWVDAYERDIFLLLNFMGMYRADIDFRVCEKSVFKNTIYLTADINGLWYPAVKEKMKVEQGQLLGHVEDFFGNKIGEYYAQRSGIVLYYTAGLAVREGDALVAYGLI